MKTRAPWLLLALVAAACRPDFGPPLSLVSAPHLLAVRFDPPEALPGAAVTATALTAAPDGALMPTIAWSLCRTPKAATENDVVSAACLAPDGTMALGVSAAPLTVTLPPDACRLFGPDTPPLAAGQLPAQARAPDVTGGYYQPLRADLDGAATIALARVRCALAGASMDSAAEFAARYLPNRNPSLTTLAASVDGTAVALDALPAGRTIRFNAGWSADSREGYPVLDPETQTLVDHFEALTISWFATSGDFATERSGRGENDLAAGDDTANDWRAPTTPGRAHLWIVLRDSRGGVDFQAFDLQLR